MRTRVNSSIIIVLIGLVPTLLGGPLFLLLMTATGMIGFREFLGLAARLEDRVAFPAAGYLVVPGFAVGSYLSHDLVVLLGITTAAVFAPLASTFRRVEATGAIVAWSLTVAGSLYLGLPVYAAILLRNSDGPVDANWLRVTAEWIAIGVPANPRGLAWILVVILATWAGDTAAFLVGRRWGKRLLLPRVSPKKTVVGSVGGLTGAAAVTALGVALFGLGLSPLAGAGIGIFLGAIGQVGDMAESLLKRQAGVKDSGTFIPGHGGVLDRIDALLFALPAALVIVAWLEPRIG